MRHLIETPAYYGKEIARRALEIKAIKLNSENPFTWASGYRMPIYNDNRLFLGYPQHRKLIAEGFISLLDTIGEDYECDIIAGTSTAGISPATTFADYSLGPMPLIYIRDKPKDHGLKNQIEGIDAENNLCGKRVLLIEDLISTGGSSAKAVAAIRDAQGECNYCFSIFNYGFIQAQQMFEGSESYESGKFLTPACEVRSILHYTTLLEVAKETGYINDSEVKMLEEWRTDPFGWGVKRGFPKVEK
ncbi:MAG: orotate phosphoribosyltransferase [Nanoarchaeota archaeon]